MKFSSKLIEDAVEAFAILPGIGRKSALRLVLHLMNKDKDVTNQFVTALSRMRENIKFCSTCHNVSDAQTCDICNDVYRDKATVCVVENLRDIMAIEGTGQFRGQYHVLGGVISPIEGIGPSELTIDDLVTRIEQGTIKEIIMAISPTIEGETTIYYISKKLKDFPVRISNIARGVSFGGELEYADEITLGRSIVARTQYSND
jgi:recombination protein RecR